MTLKLLADNSAINPKPLPVGIRGPITLSVLGFGWIGPYVFLRRFICMLQIDQSNLCCQQCSIAHHTLLNFESAIAHNQTSFTFTLLGVMATFIGISVLSSTFRNLIKRVLTASDIKELQKRHPRWSKAITIVRYVIGALVLLGILINGVAALTLYMNLPIWYDFYLTREPSAMFLETFVWFFCSGGVLAYISCLYFGLFREEG